MIQNCSLNILRGNLCTLYQTCLITSLLDRVGQGGQAHLAGQGVSDDHVHEITGRNWAASGPHFFHLIPAHLQEFRGDRFEILFARDAFRKDMKTLLAFLLACFMASAQADKPQAVDLEIGHPLDLSVFGGPGVQIVVTATDSYSVNFMVVDFDQQRIIRGSSEPSTTRQQVNLQGDHPTLLFRRGRLAVFYLGRGSSLNNVSLGVVME